MRISRLAKIKKHRIFRDFVWPNDLPAFTQFNVVYGWNGSGKTTLSGLLEHLQDKRVITEGEVEFELDNGTKIAATDIPTSNIPPVRVFNRNFVARTVEEIGNNNVAPIYFLGAESITQQKQVEVLKADLATARDTVTKANKDKRNSDKLLDDFCVDKAKLIKEALLGSTQHATYDKRRFKDAVAKLKDKPSHPAILSDEEKKDLRRKKELQAKPSIESIHVKVPDLESLRSQASQLLIRSVVSKVIDELANDPAVSTWVQQGLVLHKGEHDSNVCRFCRKELTQHRRAELEAHFNDAFAAFQTDIEMAISDIQGKRKSLETIVFPDASRFYTHLENDSQIAVNAAKQAIGAVNENLSSLAVALDRKRSNPFSSVSLSDAESNNASPSETLSSAVEALNTIIDKQKKTTTNLREEIFEACQLLEQDYVLDALPKFDELIKAAEGADTAVKTSNKTPPKLEEQIAAVELEIVEHRRPAEELNQELRAYLGRDELTFEVKDNGYALARAGKPALHLSEGERTAIAFLYFLKSLEDKAFELKNGVVVIDDPVSSLDANALFSAFGYMKERTKTCHQLIILTHNFAFFRQIKNWFHHLKGQRNSKNAERPGRFYALLATVANGERSASLSTVDRLLEEFESEYHFLFKQVHAVAHSAPPAAELAQFYGMPNISRRLIETFLAYRFPDCSGDLIKRFERVDFDAAKKTRILRLLNTYSHSIGISEPEHDPSVLAETQEVMKAILELMEAVDGVHYRGMMKLMAGIEVDE